MSLYSGPCLNTVVAARWKKKKRDSGGRKILEKEDTARRGDVSLRGSKLWGGKPRKK